MDRNARQESEIFAHPVTPLVTSQPSQPDHGLAGSESTADNAPPAGSITNQRTAITVGVALALSLAAWARLVLFHRVFSGPDVIPTDNDSAYHLRRSLLTLQDFPHVPTWDRFLAWPRGGAATWAPGFDQLLALPAWLVGATHFHAMAIMVWVPFALGVITVALTALIASRIEPEPSRRPAVIVASALVCAMVPSFAAVSQVGSTDHHVFETFFISVLSLWLLKITEPNGSLRSSIITELTGAVFLAIGIHVFTGTILYAGLAAAGLCAHHLFDRTKPARYGLFPSGALAFALAPLLVLSVDHGFIRAYGHPWHHLALSYLQPLLLFIAAIALAAFGHSRWRTQKFPLRALIAVALTVVPVALAAVILPSARHEISLALYQWLGRHSAYMADIDECTPLFTSLPLSLSAWEQARAKLSLLAPFTLLALPLAAHRARSTLRLRALPLGVVFTGLIALSLQQNRFTRAIAPLLAVTVAVALTDGVVRVKHLRSWPRAFTAVMAVTLAWISLDPSLRALTHVDPPPELLGLTAQARFIRAHMPPVRDGNRSAVFTSWAGANEVMLVGEHPTLVSSFGPYVSPALFAEADAAWRRDESYLMALLDRRDAGAVAITSADLLALALPHGVRALRIGHTNRVVIDRRWMQNVPLGAMLFGGSGIPEARVRHLEHLMPVFAENARAPYLSFYLPRGWVFGRVPGAVLEGHADTPSMIIASLPVTFRGHSRTWLGWTTTSATNSTWHLTIPLPSNYRSEGITTGPEFTITLDNHPIGTARITETDVRQGHTVAITPPVTPH